MVMMAITVMGLTMTMAARQWKTMVQRELEADLLAKGIEIQTALALDQLTQKPEESCLEKCILKRLPNSQGCPNRS